MAPRTGPQLLHTAALLVVVTYISSTGASAEPVFDSQVLTTVPIELRPRLCLPEDFDQSARILPTQQATRDLISNPANIPAECRGVPAMALFYSTIANSVGLLNADATSFDDVRLETLRSSFSADSRWRFSVSDFMARCRAGASPNLTVRQLTLYSFACFKWSQISDCDIQQTERGALDESGLLRRARFLTGSCPTSPDTLQEALQQATGRSVEECRQGLYSGDDAQQLYDAGVSLVACLLKDFTDADGVVDLAGVRGNIQSDVEYADRLDAVLDDCIETLGKATAAEFALCWAADGVFSCAIQEATDLASAFPKHCAISV